MNDISLLISNITLIYNILIYYCFAICFLTIIHKKSVSLLYWSLLLSIIVILLIKGRHEETLRSTLSFNNPNQLGYFSVILLSYVIILLNINENINRVSVKSLLVFVIIIAMAAHYLVFLSLSRGAFFSILLLDIGLLKTIFKHKIYLIFGIVLLVIGSLVIFPNLPFITGRMEARGERKSFDLKKSIVQSYERVASQLIFSSPWQVIFGRGDGRIQTDESILFGKSMDFTGYPEVHNIFGNVLRAYGIIGLFLFAFWVIKFIWASRVVSGALWVWGALLCYNMTHNGIRFRSFWMLSAFLLAIIIYLGSNQKVEKPANP